MRGVLESVSSKSAGLGLVELNAPCASKQKQSKVRPFAVLDLIPVLLAHLQLRIAKALHWPVNRQRLTLPLLDHGVDNKKATYVLQRLLILARELREVPGDDFSHYLGKVKRARHGGGSGRGRGFNEVTE